jgi:hypothetical protein
MGTVVQFRRPRATRARGFASRCSRKLPAKLGSEAGVGGQHGAGDSVVPALDRDAEGEGHER